MIPHTLTLEPGLIVHHVYVGYWYWGRPTPEEIQQDFRAITRKIRPDWDLSCLRPDFASSGSRETTARSGPMAAT